MSFEGIKEENIERRDLKDRLQMTLISRSVGMDDDSDKQVEKWLEDHSSNFAEIFAKKYTENPFFIDSLHDIPENVVRMFEEKLYEESD